MKPRIVKILRMLGVTVALVVLWAMDIVNVPDLLVRGGERIQSYGSFPLATAILAACVVKGRYTLFPTFGAIMINCSLLPLWFGIPFGIAAHMVGQAVCWYWGPASHRAGGTPLLLQFAGESKWHIVASYFRILVTDVTLLELRAKNIHGPTALWCGLPYIVLADTVVIVSGKGIFHFLKEMIAL